VWGSGKSCECSCFLTSDTSHSTGLLRHHEPPSIAPFRIIIQLLLRCGWQTSLHNPNFSNYAEICGGFGLRVTQKADLDDAIAQALAYKGPAIVEIIADPELI
jgi:hypothetical protein